MQVEALLSDAFDRVLVLADGTALLADWYDWSDKPTSLVEFKFGGAWTRVECEVQSFVCNMGRDLTFESVEAGRARISLDNRAGQFTNFVDGRPPINESTEVRLRLLHPTLNPDQAHGEQIIWWGRVANWEQEWTLTSDVVVVDAVDLIALLNEQGGALGWRAGDFGDNPSQRLTKLVNRVGLVRVNCYFDQGDTQLVNPRLDLDTVLDEAFNVALSDGGHFFSEVDYVGQPSLVYLDRQRLGRPPINISSSGLPAVPGQPFYGRPGENVIPRFTDKCGPDDSMDSRTSGLPYTDLVWSYRGWEMPSLVAVSNQAAPVERDPDGNQLPPAWGDVGHIAPGGGRRHNIVEYTRLEFYKQADADALAVLYAHVLSRARFDVSVLEVHPELDDRLWDVVTTLRQGDWVYIERHLQSDRLLAKCAIEGIEFSLDPSGSTGNGPRWKVTYRLTSLSVDATDIPPEELPPRPPGFPPLKPPLPIFPADITIADFGQEAQPGLGPTTFTERGTPFYVFELSMLDPVKPPRHKAFAWNDEYGLIELPLLLAREYDGDGIRRRYGGVQLAPGQWVVYTMDESRQSNQIVATVADWAPIVIVTDDWVPNGIAKFRYTDGRYPPAKPRIFVNGKTGDIELPIVDWSPVGDPMTTSTFEVSYRTDQIIPDEYDVWIQDPVDNRRRSAIVEHVKSTPPPGFPRLAAFDAQDWDEDKWDNIGIEWDPLPGAEKYIVRQREVGTAEWSERGEVAPYHLLRGGNNTSSIQTEKVWEVQVCAVINGQESEWTPSVYFETGFPYMIKRTDWTATAGGATVSKDDRFGLSIVGPVGPPWTQGVNPDADLFVGIDAPVITFHDMRSFLRVFTWEASVSYAQGDIIQYFSEADVNIWNVYRAEDGPIPPGQPAPGRSGSAWKKLSNFNDTVSPQNYHEATKLRWIPDDVGNLEVKYVSHTVRESIATNPSTGLGEDADFRFDFISGLHGNQAERMPNYGLLLVGTWWGDAAPNAVPAIGAWVTYSSISAEGRRFDYHPPKRPRQQ